MTGKAEIRLQKQQEPASFGEEGTHWESEQPSSQETLVLPLEEQNLASPNKGVRFGGKDLWLPDTLLHLSFLSFKNLKDWTVLF